MNSGLFKNNITYELFVHKLYTSICMSGGARGVMVIVVGNGHGNTSSNPGQDWLHFTLH